MVATASTEHSYWLALAFVAWNWLLIANASACVSCGFRLRNAHNASDCVWMETGLYARLMTLSRALMHDESITCCAVSKISSFFFDCSNFGCSSFASAGPTVWNSMSDDLRNPAVGLDQFRRNLRPTCLTVVSVSFRYTVRGVFYYSHYTNAHLLTYLLTYLLMNCGRCDACVLSPVYPILHMLYRLLYVTTLFWSFCKHFA